MSTPSAPAHPEILDVVVVGGGLGGLSAAIALAAAGKRVRLYEQATLGGKLGTVTVDGVAFDTGPSLFTLPDVAGAVVSRAGRRLEDLVTLVRPRPAFRYHFTDAPSLDIFVDLEETLASVRDTLGPKDADELRRFLAAARRTWEASRDHFVLAPAPTLTKMASLSLFSPRLLMDIDPRRNMIEAINATVRSSALRRILYRYATYNGSDHRRAPATLNCIAHVELGLGAYGVKGGMRALVEALVGLARDLGVELLEGSGVDGLVVERGVVAGVDVGGRVEPARAVVVNADVGWLRKASPASARALPRPGEPSMSGVNAVLRARRSDGRVAHEVFFSADAAREARQIFDERTVPEEPTVYLCAKEKAHAAPGWADDEPVFVMVNAPAMTPDRRATSADDEACLARGIERARQRGLLAADDAVVWSRTAAGLAARFPGSDGSLYGAASNDRRAAFQRPRNHVERMPGLYLASGSAHPGGGVPLCLQSGLLAADAVLASTPGS